MAEISNMDWAQHIKMDYGQNLRKGPVKAKKRHSQNFYRILNTCPFRSSTEPRICSNFVKFVQNFAF